MKSFRDMNPYIVGLVSLLVLGALTVRPSPLVCCTCSRTRIRSGSSSVDASGLRTGDTVRVAGVKVGRVTDIKADRENGLVIVDLVVNHGTHLGPQTEADIALETLLGAKYIRLRAPSRSRNSRTFRATTRDARSRSRARPTPVDLFNLTRSRPRTSRLSTPTRSTS